MRFEVDDLARPQVRALIDEHLADMHAASPAESVHALDHDALGEPGVTFWTAWSGEELVGCGALKQLPSDHGEIKTMRVVAASRGTGVGSAVLQFLVDEARRRGYARLSLETGTQEFFAPARALYARHGFVECGPFGSYADDPFSVFMTLEL